MLGKTSADVNIFHNCVTVTAGNAAARGSHDRFGGPGHSDPCALRLTCPHPHTSAVPVPCAAVPCADAERTCSQERGSFHTLVAAQVDTVAASPELAAVGRGFVWPSVAAHIAAVG